VEDSSASCRSGIVSFDENAGFIAGARNAFENDSRADKNRALGDERRPSRFLLDMEMLRIANQAISERRGDFSKSTSTRHERIAEPQKVRELSGKISAVFLDLDE